jgi:hypothetical protein
VFDPPPHLTGVTGGAIGAAGSGFIPATRQPAVEIVRDL